MRASLTNCGQFWRSVCSATWDNGVLQGRLFRLVLAGLLVLLAKGTAVAETVKFKSVAVPDQWTATLSGTLTFPSGKAPYPVVIFLPPCGGLTPPVIASIGAHTAELRQHGFATFVLDAYSARGLMGGKACADLAVTIIDVMVGDAFNAARTLQDQAKIDKKNIFLVGQSLGGAAALKVARAFDSRYKDTFRAIAAYYPGGCNALSVGRVRLETPLLILGAGKDDWTPIIGCELGKKAADPSKGPPFDVVVYPDALHGFDQPKERYTYKGHTLGYNAKATADSRRRLIEFFKQQLASK
jgi:dienelactone hydrolase